MIHVSPQHRMLGVPAIPAVISHFPTSKVVTYDNAPTALISHGLRETKLLRGLGFEVPAPVLGQYAWPHPPGKPPFEVQRKTVAMMTTEQRAYNLNGMGTGKTRCTMWSYDFLRSVGLARKMLVIGPISTLDFVWGAERFANFWHLKHVVLYGTRAQRIKKLEQDADIYIINHDGVEVILPELLARPDIDVIAIDELAVYRNARAKRTLTLQKLVDGRPWVWGLTGNPTPESPEDAYGQCKVVTPHTVPKKFSWFRDQTMTRVSQFRYVPKKDHKDVIYRAMQPAVRYSLDDIIELPELVEQTVQCGMGLKQAAAYDGLRKDAMALVDGNEITAVNAGAVLNKMLQVSLGYLYVREEGTEDREVLELDNKSRMDQLVADINACTSKVIVFAPFRHAVDGISRRLTDEGIEHGVVHGDISMKERLPLFNLFQNTDKPKVLVAHPLCMAHGVTLTAADTIIWFGPCNSGEVFEQANARIRRIGQTKKQLLLMYQSTKAEKAAYDSLRLKRKVQDGVLALFASNAL